MDEHPFGLFALVNAVSLISYYIRRKTGDENCFSPFTSFSAIGYYNVRNCLDPKEIVWAR
jgi:hypothetical protein